MLKLTGYLPVTISTRESEIAHQFTIELKGSQYISETLFLLQVF